jgi:hypothetical protein
MRSVNRCTRGDGVYQSIDGVTIAVGGYFGYVGGGFHVRHLGVIDSIKIAANNLGAQSQVRIVLRALPERGGLAGNHAPETSSVSLVYSPQDAAFILPRGWRSPALIKTWTHGEAGNEYWNIVLTVERDGQALMHSLSGRAEFNINDLF